MNKLQIAKNAVFLYIRTIVVIIILLYSSRVLLKNLGTEDFGLYNLIGSIVAVFTSLRVVFASATQRFLNFYRPNRNSQILANVFTISKRLHVILSVFFFLAVEGFGIWMIHNYLSIPESRIQDAYIILQCSVFSAIAILMTVPFDAVIISNEKFNVYAYMSILECALQLGAAFMLMIIPNDKLIWYSVMILIIAIIIRIINMLYCYISFEECRLQGFFDKKLFKDISKFAGWNFLGNFALSVYNEGINMLINIFGGLVANAARAISSQILKGVCSVSEKMTVAFAPQATQQYSICNYVNFQNLIIISTKLINYVYLFMSIPIAIFTPLILEIWLGEVPNYSVDFVRAVLVYGLARSIHSSLDLCFKCYGKLQKYQIIEICLLLPALPLAYVFLKNEFPLYWALLAMAIMNFINDIVISFLAKREGHFNIKQFYIKAICPLLFILLSVWILSLFITQYIENIFIQMISVCFVTIFSIIVFGFNNSEKKLIISIIKR